MPVNWLTAFIAAGAGFALAWLVHIAILADVESEHLTTLGDQKARLERSCAADKATTERANHDLQDAYAAIARKLHDARRVHPARRVVPAPQPPDPPAGRGGHAGPDAAAVDALLEYAAECERYRAERVTLERFLDDVWESRQ